MKIAFVLPGLHRFVRGAEVAFESIAEDLAEIEDCELTLVGAGQPRSDQKYLFQRLGFIPRELFYRFPKIPPFRNEYAYEEFFFALSMLFFFWPSKYDVVVTCSYPFVNWVVRLKSIFSGTPLVYVTQNGDAPAQLNNREFRFFSCDGLVCTNPEYYQRNKEKWKSVLIPNGVNTEKFHPVEVPAPDTRDRLGIPQNIPVILMVSALIPSKRVLEGIHAVATLEDTYLLIAGNGPQLKEVRSLCEQQLPGRSQVVQVSRDEMPKLYVSADLFLHMSLDEPSANAYIEALACGLPIVTHDREVTKWTLEDCAILVDTEQQRLVVDGIQRAMSLDRGKQRADAISLVARKYKWKDIAAQYLQFFRDVIS